MAVTLVVKTPSLKLSDLTYSCDSKSTILQLKTFLQEQYPSKPKPEEQRLIYQGRLLRDDEVLQDFLRDLDHEQRHTLHLVYTLKRSPSAENQMAGVPSSAPTIANLDNDGLRQRHHITSASQPVVAQPLQPAEWVANGQLPGAAAMMGADPLTQQMIWWQQNYAQQYWSQYMHQLYSQQQYQAATSTAQQAQSVPHYPPRAGAAVAAPVAPEVQQPAVEQPAEQQQQARRPPLAAVGGVAQDDDEEGGIRAARDWLDWIYVGSRLAILLGVMYYYSSLPRFMLVTLIVAGIYLYQKAIHQRRHVVPPAAAQQRPAAEVNNNVGQAPAVPPEEAPAEHVADPAAEAPQPAAQVAPTDAAVTPTAFNVALNLLIGFFTSLIPEVPAPEALN